MDDKNEEDKENHCDFCKSKGEEDGYYYAPAANAYADGEAEGYKYNKYNGWNVEGGNNYRGDRYHEGDGVLGHVHLPGVDEDGLPEGRPIWDWLLPTSRQGLPLFCSWSLCSMTGRI